MEREAGQKQQRRDLLQFLLCVYDALGVFADRIAHFRHVARQRFHLVMGMDGGYVDGQGLRILPLSILRDEFHVAGRERLDGARDLPLRPEIEGDDENTPKYIYKKKVKVALSRGEPAFTEAAEELKSLNPLPPLELKNEICVALPEKEEEIKDSSYLREQVKILRENTHVDVFFKDLIKIPEVSALLMIVDDSSKSPGKKRQAVLNPNYKYIGISSKFIGKTFVAYFTFSKK